MYYRIAADLILIVHFGFVLFVVLSVPVVWIGYFLNRKYVHDPIFRITHLAAMGLVIAQALCSAICPLTKWEAQLRLKAGAEQVYPGTFIQYWVHKIMFYEASQSTFLIIYLVFFAVIILTFVIVRPQRKRKN